MLVGAFLACGGGEKADCSAEQGWSDDVLSGLTSEQSTFSPLEPRGFGLNTRAGMPLVRGADGGLILTIVAVDTGFNFPVSIESVAFDGGPAPFQLHAYLDGEPWPLTFSQNGATVGRPAADASGVATFEVGCPKPRDRGAHDLVLVTSSDKPAGAVGAGLTWVYGETTQRGATGPTAMARFVARDGSGGQLRGPDGSIIFFPVRFAPQAGVFEWTAHLEDDSDEAARTCEGSMRRYRLFALLDGAPWPFSTGLHHLDVEVPIGAAGEVTFRLEGLPDEPGHVVVVLLQRNAGSYQVRPDGTLGPWFSPIVAELGAAWW